MTRLESFKMVLESMQHVEVSDDRNIKLSATGS